ncbi:actin interacting protein, partial [Lasius niger]
MKTIPASTKSTLEYFKDEQFEATEDVYHTALDYMSECLEELEPV